jgi:hypothetical protein
MVFGFLQEQKAQDRRGVYTAEPAVFSAPAPSHQNHTRPLQGTKHDFKIGRLAAMHGLNSPLKHWKIGVEPTYFHAPKNTSRDLSAPHAAAAAQFAFLRSAQLVTLKPSIHVDIHGEIWWGISLISPPM